MIFKKYTSGSDSSHSDFSNHNMDFKNPKIIK